MENNRVVGVVITLNWIKIIDWDINTSQRIAQTNIQQPYLD
jgi:hypothetical protein